jgi:hypothetical protein
MEPHHLEGQTLAVAMETPGTCCSTSLPVEHNTLCNTYILLWCAFVKNIIARTRNTKRSRAWNISVSLI